MDGKKKGRKEIHALKKRNQEKKNEKLIMDSLSLSVIHIVRGLYNVGKEDTQETNKLSKLDSV